MERMEQRERLTGRRGERGHGERSRDERSQERQGPDQQSREDASRNLPGCGRRLRGSESMHTSLQFQPRR